MEIIYSRNVNDAYYKGVHRVLTQGHPEPSRAGPVIVVPTPVVNVYTKPTERVLFDARRDANPFFHLMEAVWMLAGRRDANWLDQFVKDFSQRYGESNGEAHGAYGYRWRQHFKGAAIQIDSSLDHNGDEGVGIWEFPALDQLKEAGRLLRENPMSRQVVMAMWDPAVDLGAKKGDIPCNDLVMFRAIPSTFDGERYELNMSIVARSHDAVWGAYGANAVHMSVMHEVVAALAGMDVGTYIHFSNNFHIYESVLEKIGDKSYFLNDGIVDAYGAMRVSPQPVAVGPIGAEQVLLDCEQFCQNVDAGILNTVYGSPWVRYTVQPMLLAHLAWKAKQYDEALELTQSVLSSDWAAAARQWMQRRLDKQKRRAEQDVN